MFNKYGEFDSYEEINKKAEELKEAGDTLALLEFAAENGIDKEDVEDYVDGGVDDLCTPMIAALGKIKIESAEYKIDGTLKDWISELIEAIEHEPELCLAVRRKGKSIAGYIAATADYGYKHRVQVDKRIVDMCPEIKKIIGNHPFSIGIPDRGQRKRLMHEYYLGGAK